MSLTIDGNSSDDDMIDIQIEESLGRETLMAIDSANFREDLVSILGFILILVITSISGLLGPRPLDSKIQVNKFVSSSSLSGFQGPQSQEISMTITNISTYNRFFSFYISFNRGESPAPLDQTFSYAYKVTTIKGNQKQTKSNYVDGVHLKSVDGVKTSPRIKIFTTKIVNFDTLQFYATVDSVKGYNSINLIEENGFVQNTYFQIYFKLTFAVIEIAFLVLFVNRLQMSQFKLWHLEQKLTAPLLLLVIVYNNPFSWFTIAHPTNVTLIIDEIISCLFTVYFRFFILVLFDSLRYKNRKTDQCFFIPKIVFCIFNFLVLVIHGIYNVLSSSPQKRADSSSAIDIFELFLLIVYLVWVTASIGIAGCKVDITERYKYIIYCVSGITALILLALSDFFLGFLGYLENSALKFVESYAIVNVYVMLMAYFHWPYEVLHDQNYMGGDDSAKATMPADFFVNNDSDDGKLEN